jgi:hypothetical protein
MMMMPTKGVWGWGRRCTAVAKIILFELFVSYQIGGGKSSATWAWACQKAETTASALWAHVPKGGGAVVAKLSEKTVKVVGTL